MDDSGTGQLALQDDELDFRPAKPARAPGNNTQSSRPANASSPSQQGAGDIDFQPKEKPPTFSTLYEPSQGAAPSLADRAMRAGQSSPDVKALAQKTLEKGFDLTGVPRSPFTNELEVAPPIRTEEETRRAGTMGATPRGGAAHGTPYESAADIGERVIRAVGTGAPAGSKVAEWTGQPGTKDNVRLFAPEQLMTESEQQRHPILTGAGEFAGGMTSPESLALIGLTAGAGELAGPGAATARRLLSAGFSIPMLVSAARTTPQIADAFRRGDTSTGERLLTQAVLQAGTAGLAGHGMFEESAPLTVARGTVSRPLAIDEATSRAEHNSEVNAKAEEGFGHLDAMVRQSFLRRALTRIDRMFPDLDANMAARRGLAHLDFVERGLKTASDARVNAPVEVPKTYEGETPTLQGRAAGPERNPLEVEAEQARTEQSERQPDFRVTDLRRVKPEASEEHPPYYELSGQAEQQSRGVVERPAAGETVGAEGRSKTITDLAARVLGQRENSLVTRFGPDVLDEARQELNAAAGLASSFERPGRYFAGIGQTEEPIPQRSQSSAKGIHAGGTWYGVGSAREMIEGMHPWYADVEEGPETLGRIAQEGKGAAFERILDRVATQIQSERESARPVIEEFAPQLRSLAGQVRETDPDLAQTMLDLAEGRVRGLRNLRELVERTVSDGQRAAEFTQAINEAANEARESSGAEEASRTGDQARERESAPSRELAAPEIDFAPLPEAAPIHPQEVEDMSRLLGRRVTADELPEIRRRLDAERNISEGLRGNRRDTAGEIREQHRSELDRERQTREPGEEPAERYSGVSPRAIAQSAKFLQRAWGERVAQPFIDRVLKIGDKYTKAREADPAVAEGLHLLDNAPQYLRAKAAQEVHNVIGDLSREKERLFVLMADADSRENLRTNHPDEYAQAQRDPAVQEALRKYRPLEQELTQARQRMGGATIDDDYLRRVYDKYVAGVGHAEAPGTPERGTSAYDRVIRPQRVGNVSREAESGYYYRNGLHEFGPSFATKFIATHLKGLRDQVAREFMGNATFVQSGESEPRFILYNGERYYRPDVARDMRESGVKGAKEYDRYDPTAGEKFPVPAEGKFLGPRELVKTLTDFGRREESEPGALRRFFQEQILGFGFGVPHIANIMRRVSQSVPGGGVNPQGWLEAWRVGLSKELRERGIAGLNDPTFDMLAKRGAISTGEMGHLKEYWGGNMNPANWARKMAAVGHQALFEPGSFGGLGGIDQRARLYIADLIRSQRPELSDTEVARAVRDQLGDYSRTNWSDRQTLLGKFMMFPGWDASSIRWVLQHPIKTTVPPALVVLLANQALHQFGQNRAEDQTDIANIHIGDRAYGTSLLRESVARNLFRPALAYAQAKIRGENDQRASAEAARGMTSGAGGLLSMLRPDLSGFIAMATNRQALFSGKELVTKDDFAQPGKVLPSRAIEKEAVFALRHAVPALDRMLDSSDEIDLKSFAGGNLGVPNYRDDAEKRLLRNAAEAQEVRSTIGKLAKSDPHLAQRYVRDPDNAAYALFSHDLAGLAGTLKRMNEAKERIEGSGLPDADKKSRIANVDKARANLLRQADGLNNLLFERRTARKQGATPGVPPSLAEKAMQMLSDHR